MAENVRWSHKALYEKFCQMFPYLKEQIQTYTLAGPNMIKLKGSRGVNYKFVYLSNRNWLCECFTEPKKREME